MKLIFILFLIVSLTSVLAHNSTANYLKKFYGCPKNFVQIGRRCYFFSKHTATWQDAYYRCRNRKSNIAIIKTANQDRRIKKLLSRPTHAMKERWIGGRYDWRQMKWIWAASGHPITYQGFFSTNFTDEQKWHCITMDPALFYKWNTKFCTEKKPYICHTKTRIISNKKRISSLDDTNEIPLPNTNNNSSSNSKGNRRDINYSPQELRYRSSMSKLEQKRRRNKNNKRKKLNNRTILLHRPVYNRDSTFSHNRRHHKLSNDTLVRNDIPMETIRYEIYKENTPIRSSLYPKPIVEEYSFMKSP